MVDLGEKCWIIAVLDYCHIKESGDVLVFFIVSE